MKDSNKSNSKLPVFNSHVYCNEYLVDGILHSWKGATTEVFSTIHSKDKEGNIGPTLLGSIPDMETETALAAKKYIDNNEPLIITNCDSWCFR